MSANHALGALTRLDRYSGGIKSRAPTKRLLVSTLDWVIRAARLYLNTEARRARACRSAKKEGFRLQWFRLKAILCNAADNNENPIMKLASFIFDGRQSVGIVQQDVIIDLHERVGVNSMADLLDGRDLGELCGYAQQSSDPPIDKVRFLPPVGSPRHCICVGINYRDHLEEVQRSGIQRAIPKYPSLFIRFADTFVGHNAPLSIPVVSAKLDYEGELAVIIGRAGKDLSPSAAMAIIAGYACFNDASVRDWQFHSSQITPGKNFPETGAFGPYLVTYDEVADPHDLELITKVNGEVVQHGNTKDMIFRIGDILSYISTFLTFQPGDVVVTGTPAGVGFSKVPPKFLKDGDVCEIHIQNVGTLANTVAAAKSK